MKNTIKNILMIILKKITMVGCTDSIILQVLGFKIM